jgi:hypothetical protein
MVQFEHEPEMLYVLTGTNTTAQRTGEKRSHQQDREPFSKNWPVAKNRCIALMNAHYSRND